MAKWWLISDNDVRLVRATLEAEGLVEALGALDRGLHTLAEEELDAVEDAFFAENSSEERERLRPILERVWEKLCPPGR